jgi:hypothetical protein
MRLQSEQGFIALISAILISVLLLAITLTISFSGYFARFNVLDSESKERSSALAEGCADTAILDLSLSQNLPRAVTIGSDTCTIVQETPSLPIKTQASVNKAWTNLQVTVDADYNVVSWEEVPNF